MKLILSNLQLFCEYIAATRCKNADKWSRQNSAHVSNELITDKLKRNVNSLAIYRVHNRFILARRDHHFRVTFELFESKCHFLR